MEFIYIYRGDGDIVDGTGKGSLAIKLLSNDSVDYLIRMPETHCVILCVCVFAMLGKTDKLVHKKRKPWHVPGFKWKKRIFTWGSGN